MLHYGIISCIFTCTLVCINHMKLHLNCTIKHCNLRFTGSKILRPTKIWLRITRFPEFKETVDKKHDMESFDRLLHHAKLVRSIARATDALKWTKSDQAMVCRGTSLSPAARAVSKYSLGLDEADQNKPHCCVFYGCKPF